MWHRKSLRKLGVMAVLGAALALITACASPEDLNRVAAEAKQASTQVSTELQAIKTDLAKVKTEASAASEKLAPKTQKFAIMMGEGEVIQEVGGEEKLTGEFHRWDPAVLVVNKGDKVILEVNNPRSGVHSFVLKEFGMDSKKLAPRGGKATVEFVANKAGIFEWNCGVDFDPKAVPHECDPDHRRQLGYLIVLDR